MGKIWQSNKESKKKPALTQKEKRAVKREKKHPQYLFGAGLCFYLFWVVFSLVGILLATALPNLLNYHLDFSIIAIFVAMILYIFKD